MDLWDTLLPSKANSVTQYRSAVARVHLYLPADFCNWQTSIWFRRGQQQSLLAFAYCTQVYNLQYCSSTPSEFGGLEAFQVRSVWKIEVSQCLDWFSLFL